MSDLLWYPVQGVAAVALGVAAGLLLRAVLLWLHKRELAAKRRHSVDLYVGPNAPRFAKTGDIWVRTKKPEEML